MALAFCDDIRLLPLRRSVHFNPVARGMPAFQVWGKRPITRRSSRAGVSTREPAGGRRGDSDRMSGQGAAEADWPPFACREVEGGMDSSSRYFVTVRLAIFMPSWVRVRAISSSVRGRVSA